jgi:quercetin dioxygenase-like cupin family protein
MITVPSTREASKLQDLSKWILQQKGSLVGDSSEFLKEFKLKHEFGQGLYIRTLYMPKGMVMVTKIHRHRHPFFVIQGKVSVYINGETSHFEAPYKGITEPATQRVIYAHEDTEWVTVHATTETDLDKIEEELIAPNFDEFLIEEGTPCPG